MRFLDPHPCRCPVCATEHAMPVRELLTLQARCPACGASLRDTGLEMRHLADEATAFYHAFMILQGLEENFGIPIASKTVEVIQPQQELTLEHLLQAAHQSMPAIPRESIREALTSIVRAETPELSVPLDFASPLLEVVSPHRYGT